MTLIDARDLVTQPGGWTKCKPIGHAIHHSVTEVRADATIEDELNHIMQIDAYHVYKEYGGFGYHTATFPSGRSYQTGDWDGARAHVMYRNPELVGSVAIGNFTASTAPPLIIAGLAECVAEARRVFGRELPINGHGQWADPRAPSSCPGLIRAQLDAIIAAIEEEPMSQEQVDTLIQQMEDVIAFTKHQKNLNIVNATVQGQVQGLLDAHPPGAHAGGTIAEIAENLKVVAKGD